MRSVTRPNIRAELLRLKNFQRDTVEYVFDAMYQRVEHAHRFLIADEVGLGKTLVARGIVAKVIERLWDEMKRIDIVYICSNGSIARQNINRLNVMESQEATLPSRITLLPKFIHGLNDERRKVNFISLTPKTSFNLRSNLGTAEERALLYWLLPDDWKPKGRETGAKNALQGDVERERFRARIDYSEHDRVDVALREAFQEQLVRESALGADFSNLCERFAYSHKPDLEDRGLRSSTIGRLRVTLACSCIHALKPQLIILDEFQRFKDLLDGTDQASELAQRLFEYEDARVLLLSATPYKMYTAAAETETDDHFRDFLQTVTFLQNDAVKTEQFKTYLNDYRAEILKLDGRATEGLLQCRLAVEGQLREIMVRTERLAVTPDRNGMLSEARTLPAKVERGDLVSYLGFARIAQVLGQPDVIEYWKSAPYLLNFMDEYRFKEEFTKALAIPDRCAQIRSVLSTEGEALLDWNDVERYRKLDPKNARLRQLISEVVEPGLWQLLWIPPALPYYKASSPFNLPDAARFTKRLVFSSWQVVPKVLAALLTYDVERRMFSADGNERLNTVDRRARFTTLLQFTRSEGLPANLSLLGLMYPSIALAAAGDPLRFVSPEDGLASQTELLNQVEIRVKRLLGKLSIPTLGTGPADERWYWAAPILLDLYLYPSTTHAWLAQDSLADLWRGEEGLNPEDEDMAKEEDERQDAWGDHVEEAKRLETESLNFGPQPPDLAVVLARLAVGGPATVALRALSRISGGASAIEQPYLRNAAGWIAWGFRSLFNLPEVTALLRSANGDEPYWLRVAEYCVAGGLQAVLDEYVHVLLEWEGVAHRPAREAVRTIARRVAQSLQLRTANLGVDGIAVDGERVLTTDRRMRSRFAARFGVYQSDEGARAVRQDDVRAAFNSPFWPFVLCSTSVGQEGLDFHLYCHAVVHWNLPSNPVDLEQREGRVHRYKGHAVRKNVARLYGKAASTNLDVDPWACLFEAAEKGRDQGASDLVPYWVLPIEGGAQIERHVPMLPLSRDTERIEFLRRALTAYRMVFGQARQEDLVAYLQRRIPPDQILRMSEELRIDLAPPQCPAIVATEEELAESARRRFAADGLNDLALWPKANQRAKHLSVKAAIDLLDGFRALCPKVDGTSIDRIRDVLDRFTVLRDVSLAVQQRSS